MCSQQSSLWLDVVRRVRAHWDKSLRNSDAIVPTWAWNLKTRLESILCHSWIGCARNKVIKIRDTIIAAKRRCLYLVAALAIDEEPQKRLDEAEEQEKAITLQRITQRKARVRKWLTKSPGFGQYDNLLTELHKEDQRGLQ